MTKKVKIILLIASIIVVVVLGYALWPKKVVNNGQPSNNQPAVNGNTNTEPIDNKPTENQEPEIITSDIDTSEWKTYRNEEYGINFKYPDNWRVVENKKGEPKNDPLQALLGIFVRDNNDQMRFFILVDSIDYNNYKQDVFEYYEQLSGLSRYKKDFKIYQAILNKKIYNIYESSVYNRIIIPFEYNKMIFEFAWNSSINEYDKEWKQFFNAIILSLNLSLNFSK